MLTRRRTNFTSEPRWRISRVSESRRAIYQPSYKCSVGVLRLEYQGTSLPVGPFCCQDSLQELVDTGSGHLIVQSKDGKRTSLTTTQRTQNFFLGALDALRTRSGSCPFKYSCTEDGLEMVNMLDAGRIPVGINSELSSAVLVVTDVEEIVVTTAGVVWSSKWGSKKFDFFDRPRMTSAVDHLAARTHCEGYVLPLSHNPITHRLA